MPTLNNLLKDPNTYAKELNEYMFKVLPMYYSIHDVLDLVEEKYPELNTAYMADVFENLSETYYKAH